MMSRTTPMRWISSLLLLLALVASSVAFTSAQEEGIGTPAATATSEIDNQVSIGGETVSLIGDEDGASLPADDPASSGADSEGDDTATSSPGSGGDIGADEAPGVATGEGSPAPDDGETGVPETETEIPPAASETPDEPVSAAAVGVAVIVYLCSADYAGGDPAGSADCGPANGVDVAVAADGTSLGVQTTDPTGAVEVDAPDGSQVVFSEVQSTLPAGYVPNGDGVSSVTAVAGASATIINIAVETAGRVQISNGQCPTSGEARTQFIVVGPLAVQAAGLGCEPHGGTTLTLTGPGGSYSAGTDGDGNWIGTLPIGSYTIANANGSAELDVQAGATTIVLVVDYVPGPKGTLTIQRFDCAEGSEGTTITIDGGPNNDSCLPSGKSVSVSAVVGADDPPPPAPLVIDLGEDGSTSIDVAAGGYVVTDGPTGVSAAVQVDEGSSVTATINSTILTGVVSASVYWCNSAVSSSVNPDSWGNWTKKCGRAAEGIQVTLLDADGDVVSAAATGSSGALSFSSLMPGRYSLRASGGCALFANGADARNGFDIAAGDTVDIAVFGCDAPTAPQEPADPGPGSGSIGGQDGTGSGDSGSFGGSWGGGSPMQNPDYHTRNLVSNPLASVSTLPSTGEGANGISSQLLMLLLGMAALSAGGALALSTGRKKRTG